MKRLLSLLSLFSLLLFSLTAWSGQIADFMTVAKDEAQALAKLGATPGRHVLVYFGDHLN